MMPDPATPSDERDALEFINVGLTRAEADLLATRLVRECGGDVETLLAEAWLYGATAARFAMQGHRVCHVCGCWELQACVDTVTGHACSWVGPNLCSTCKPGPRPLICEEIS